jgi:hypothetical protein
MHGKLCFFLRRFPFAPNTSAQFITRLAVFSESTFPLDGNEAIKHTHIHTDAAAAAHTLFTSKASRATLAARFIG